MLDYNRRQAFLLLVSIIFGVLKKLYQDLTNLIRI